jgi:3-oxoacyl-[acyl-carrier protein] reductase
MDLSLDGRTALVLGAGGGLGGAIASRLATEGANVAVADINEDAVHATAARVEACSAKAFPLQWDLSDLDVVDNRVSAVEAALGPVEILVNITGGPPPSPAAGQSADLWRSSFESMILSVITITDRVLPSMTSRGWGRILTSTSSGVVSPIPNLGISNALRLGLVGWSKTLASEVGKSGVTSNIIVPGRIATPRIQFLDERKAEREGRSVVEVSRASAASIPVGRYGTPEEYADMAAFLCSDRASYVTGSVIRVDGGLIPSA